MVRHCSWVSRGRKVRVSLRAMGARRTFGASIGEALQELEPALAPPAIVRCVGSGVVCVFRADIPEHMPWADTHSPFCCAGICGHI